MKRLLPSGRNLHWTEAFLIFMIHLFSAFFSAPLFIIVAGPYQDLAIREWDVRKYGDFFLS